MIEAKMDMKYADKVATECLESILGYRLESYKEPEIAAIGNIQNIFRKLSLKPKR